MAEGESLAGPEELDAGEPHRLLICPTSLLGVLLRRWERYNKGYVVTRVGPHDLARGHGPVQPVDPSARVLYHQSSCVHRLAVPHYQY